MHQRYVTVAHSHSFTEVTFFKKDRILDNEVSLRSVTEAALLLFFSLEASK